MELGNVMAKNHGSVVDKGSYLRLLTLTDGSSHIAGSHQPVVNGAPPPQNKRPNLVTPGQKFLLPAMWKE
jgi:hypothetical protein